MICLTVCTPNSLRVHNEKLSMTEIERIPSQSQTRLNLKVRIINDDKLSCL